MTGRQPRERSPNKKAPTAVWPSHGGRNAISGFLFQILRSVQLGLHVAANVTLGDDVMMRLTLEPEAGGDHRLDLGHQGIVEQVKLRADRRRWSPGEVSRTVFRDLLIASSPGSNQSLRLATNNGNGLGSLQRFLEARRDQIEGSFEWGQSRLALEEFEDRLAEAAEVERLDPKFQHLLDNFAIELVEKENTEIDIDAMLRPMLAPGQEAETKRHELMGRLFEAASTGRTISAGDLLALIHPEALLRLGLSRSLPSMLRTRIGRDCELLGYNADLDARHSTVDASGALVLISGESGQGKTWQLCSAARVQSETDELVVIMSAPSSVSEIIQTINDRIWLPAFENPVSIAVMARRLRPTVGNRDGYWLTVYLDDLQDRELARSITDLDWADHGVRLVISAQPRITDAIISRRPDAISVLVQNFTSAELRRYLRSHGRHDSLLYMPDDVFELLLKPIHALVFSRLPASHNWRGATEYELFRAYWNFATIESRAQGDHPHDRDGLVRLVTGLLTEQARYPWPTRDFARAGLGNDAIIRLETVGLLRHVGHDLIGFASDRMLNWAVAEALSTQVDDEMWSPERTASELHRLGELASPRSELLGRRLGYVFLDSLWLLADRMPPCWVAQLVLDDERRRPQEWESEAFWSQQLATLGSVILPSLEYLAANAAADDLQLRQLRFIPTAIAEIADSDHVPALATIGRLLASENSGSVDVGLMSASHVAAPNEIDRIWTLHLERELAFEEGRDTNAFTGLLHQVQISQTASRLAIAANPSWLDERLANSSDPYELNHLLWALVDDRCINDELGSDIWLRCRAHLRNHVPADSTAMVEAIGRFQDRENREWLRSVPSDETISMTARVLSSEVRLDPAAALSRLRDRNEDYPWSGTDLWLPELARVNPEGLADAIMESARQSDHPLTEVVLFYNRYSELIDAPTLAWVLDEFAVALRLFNEADNPDAELGRLGHCLRFLAGLFMPWQFACLRLRAGTPLETQLLRFATGRSGRNSRTVDHEGQQCERLLAMIDGDGFHSLVVAELNRAGSFGREDGLAIAKWSEESSIADRLAREARHDPGADTYRGVLLMEALACHVVDVGIELMIQNGSPIYLNASHIRKSPGRTTFSLQGGMETLLATGHVAALDFAAKLAAFLSSADQAQALVPILLSPETGEETKRTIIASFHAMGFYEPTFLGVLEPLLGAEQSDQARFLAGYLATCGDTDARLAILGWLTGLDLRGWTYAYANIVDKLLDDQASREGALAFLRRMREAGLGRVPGHQLLLLAEAGDIRARDDLHHGAYRESRLGDHVRIAGIRYLAASNREEASFAAHRYLIRDEGPEAIKLLLEVDPDGAMEILINFYERAKPSTKQTIARQMRLQVPFEVLKPAIDCLADANSQSHRLIAAELAGWMPPDMSFAWLDEFVADSGQTLRKIARDAMQRRARESAGMQHIHEMARASKPSKWARLIAIFECIDPHLLWSARDPASLQDLIRETPHEFYVEAESLWRRASKRVQDEAQKLDDKWARR